VLTLAHPQSITLLSNVGLGFLFLLAGYELDPSLLRERPGRLAIIAWLVTAVLALVTVGGLTQLGFVRDFVPISLALTTTALGTLLPILRDNEMLEREICPLTWVYNILKLLNGPSYASEFHAGARPN
jgi:Kef-type K+ transport system membrane component KefB